jgi:TetR/AcrR family transcriptional regulator, ethionamide resistance regulator
MPARRASGPARRSTESAAADLRDRILAATRELLQNRSFSTVSVADILAAAEVSRASFYFYFPSKQAVLGELVRIAVAEGQRAAQPWLDGHDDPIDALRAGVTTGAQLWRANAGVLKAIVESWGSDDALRALWLEQMNLFTEATLTRIEADPKARQLVTNLDIRAVAASMTWLGERLYYLAAARVPPFDDEVVLVDVLTNAWTSVLYGHPVPARGKSRRT